MNANDRYAVAVVKNEIIIGHVKEGFQDSLSMQRSYTVTGG